jgi:C4-type Zn-finger protein
LDTVEKFKSLCFRFKNGEFDIEELQSRLRTTIHPEPPIPSLEILLHDIDNELELIRFTKLDSNQYQCGMVAIEQFMEELKKKIKEQFYFEYWGV